MKSPIGNLTLKEKMSLVHYQEAFFKVANECNCWIGLREPNPLSAKWMGLPGYIPKGENCKAKTADARQHHLAGLVVDPHICPEAFEKSTMPHAYKKWKDFTKNGTLPGGFTRVDTGRDKGLIKHHGKAIFADYDLMNIFPADVNGNKRATPYNSNPGDTYFSEEQHNLEQKTRRLLNQYLGIPLIQHGSEFSWKGGIGAAACERVIYFGPNGQREDHKSSMPTTPDKWH